MSLTTIKILNSHSLSILQTNRICERRKDVENFTVPEKLLEIKKKLAKKFFIGFAADASNIEIIWNSTTAVSGFQNL